MENNLVEKNVDTGGGAGRILQFIGAGVGVLMIATGAIMLIYLFFVLSSALFHPEDYEPVFDGWQEVLTPKSMLVSSTQTELKITIGQGDDFLLRYGPVVGDDVSSSTLTMVPGKNLMQASGRSSGGLSFLGFLPPLIIVIILFKISLGLVSMGKSLVTLASPWEKLYKQLVSSVRKHNPARKRDSINRQ